MCCGTIEHMSHNKALRLILNEPSSIQISSPDFVRPAENWGAVKILGVPFVEVTIALRQIRGFYYDPFKIFQA